MTKYSKFQIIHDINSIDQALSIKRTTSPKKIIKLGPKMFMISMLQPKIFMNGQHHTNDKLALD